MSDYLFSTEMQPKARLAESLRSIHTLNPPDALEFHGPWGSLAVLQNHYRGFDPYQDDRYIAVVVGGPFLTFRLPHLETNATADNARTAAVLHRWKKTGGITWDEDLSGPFSILCVDKQEKTLHVVTDLLSSIPVFHARARRDKGFHVFGTHVDTVADIAGLRQDLDPVSIADFIVNCNVTYPYTSYHGVSQLSPATESSIGQPWVRTLQSSPYWFPLERCEWSSVAEAAEALRTALQTSVHRACGDHKRVGVLLSGGEDSRFVLACIPAEIERVCCVFVDSHNREARTAARVARIYRSPVEIRYRSPVHYLEQLEACARLIGSQYEAQHVHAYRFHEDMHFEELGAVLGGVMADRYFKDPIAQSRHYRLRGIEVLPSRVNSETADLGVPLRRNHGEPQLSKKKLRALISPAILETVDGREQAHVARLREMRPQSCAEWLNSWPIQGRGWAFFHGHRRLFRSYEPYMDSQCIKLAASIPLRWRLNRRLFQRAVKPLLRPAWYVPHATEGHFPYVNYVANIPLRWVVRSQLKLARFAAGKAYVPQGSFPDWDRVAASDSMEALVAHCEQAYGRIAPIFQALPYGDLIRSDTLTGIQRLRVIQVLSLMER